jgi:hypothetical protein
MSKLYTLDILLLHYIGDFFMLFYIAMLLILPLSPAILFILVVGFPYFLTIGDRDPKKELHFLMLLIVPTMGTGIVVALVGFLRCPIPIYAKVLLGIFLISFYFLTATLVRSSYNGRI